MKEEDNTFFSLLSAITGVFLILMSVYFFFILDYKRADTLGIAFLINEGISGILTGVFFIVLSLTDRMGMKHVPMYSVILGVYTTSIGFLGALITIYGHSDTAQYIAARSELVMWIVNIMCGGSLIVGGVLMLWEKSKTEEIIKE